MVLWRLYIYVAILLVINIQSVKSLLVEQAVIKKNTPPGRSCSKVENMPGNAECFIQCLTEMMNLHAFSRRVDTGECRCCNTPEEISSASSAPVDNSTWDTFYPGMCGDGFTYMAYKDNPLCLSHIRGKVMRMEAVSHCRDQSSELVSIDTPEKQKMVLDFIGGTSILDVWFQERENAEAYQLQLPFVCETTPVFTTWREKNKAWFRQIQEKSWNLGVLG